MALTTFMRWLCGVLLWSAAGIASAQTVLVVGDSLAEEYGLTRGTGWVPLLAQRIAQQYPKYQVVNASISGDTTSSGLSRLPALLVQQHPAIVVIELGSNDALRGLPLNMTESNLRTMALLSRQAGARVLLIGMQAPPNYGRRYTQQFADLFPAVAKSEGAALAPFLMEGVALRRDLFQADGLHPNEAAQPQLMENVWAVLKGML